VNLCSSSRRRKRRRLSNDIAAADDDCTSHANNKTIEELFKAYQEEVKIKEQVQEELRQIFQKKLANLERAIYPRSLFEKGFDHYGKRHCSSASQYGSYLLSEKGFAQMLVSSTNTYRNGFKTDVKKFVRDFY
jgi:hypothetical protein